MTTDEPNVSLGDVSHSTFAIGSHASAVAHHGTAPRRDEAAEELLKAVRELRADLTRVRADEGTDALRTALEETEEEITRTGRAAPTRRERLRELLTDSQALLSVLASAGAVAGLVGL
jgi:IS5 family transposase